MTRPTLHDTCTAHYSNNEASSPISRQYLRGSGMHICVYISALASDLLYQNTERNYGEPISKSQSLLIGQMIGV